MDMVSVSFVDGQKCQEIALEFSFHLRRYIPAEVRVRRNYVRVGKTYLQSGLRARDHTLNHVKVNHLVNLLVLINPRGVICSIINISLLIQLFPIQNFQKTHI